MRVAIHTVLMAVLLLGVSLPAAAQSVEEILATHLEALGGAEAVQSIESLHQRGEMLFDSPFTGPLKGEIEIVLVPNRKLFQDSRFEAFRSTTGWDGSVGWERGAQGLRILEGEELQRLAAQSDPFFTARLNRFAEAEVVRGEDRELNGVPHYSLDFRAQSGLSIRVFLSQETHLVTQTVQTLRLPELGEVLAVTDFWDFERHGGVSMPSSVTFAIEGVYSAEADFTVTEINGEVDESRFAVPR